MASVRIDDKEYDLPDSGDWTAGELGEAERAIGAAFNSGSQGDDMAISYYIAVRREVSSDELPPARLGDLAKRVKMNQLTTDKDEDEDETPAPLETPFGPAEPPTFGPLRSAASE